MAQWVSHPSPRRRFHLLHEASALLHDVFLRQEIDWDERPRSPQVLKVAEHIAHHFAEPLEVPRLAQIAGISPRALATLFQREFRTTVPQFIARVRTREAARLLEQSPLSIDEIAERTGFPNRYYLTRVFTRVTGKPPARYRRESASTDREGPQAPSTPTTPQSDSTARDEQQSRG
nr:AraC family transcriptional regulator [Haloferula luteola]